MTADRRLLGLVLAWAILPLPFTGMTLLPFWLVTAAAAAWLVLLPNRTLGLPNWVQNLAAVIILIVVAAAGGFRVGPLRPLGHLLLLLATVQVLLVADRKAFVRALPTVALLWLISVASSTHIALLGYLIVSAGIAWWVGMRVLLSGLPGTAGARTVPRPFHAAAAAALACALAVPVFLAMPRLRSPWIAGAGGSRSVTGFSTAVELGSVGAIHESREVSLVLTAAEGRRVQARWTRLRATAFDLLRTGSWAPRRRGVKRPELHGDLVWLAGDRDGLSGTDELTIEILRPERYLFLPEDTVAVRSPTDVRLDPAGGLMLRSRWQGPLSYQVWVAKEPVALMAPPTPRDRYLPRRNPGVAALAREIAGSAAGARERAEAVVNYLQANYSYSLDVSAGRWEADPVGWFLLVGRAGHCEYFAGSMVVLLRTLGVPARMVGGYSGGTASPSGREVLVRQANAHTWVEVWLGQREGWVSFDPTPSVGIPSLDVPSRADRLRQTWDWALMTWDRHVLTFGLSDQVELVASSLGGALGLARSPRLPLWLGATALIAAMLTLFGRRRAHARPPFRSRGPAAAAVGRLARRLERGGETVPAGATLGRIGVSAARRWPEAAGPIARLVRLADEELFAPGCDTTHARDAREAWREVHRALSAPR